ncbi:SusC/RagA family TonB-linked outer membrane protein [uncultured Parabacteroides sp.]|uniref:SusC/RagA family TonB-linked outer membrane protein n=1 Tax=uncultured Parabacteroides sp. TaxID=512312 RepID=UPI002603FB1F|nr:SusC/RagA family TonB-linked outer membrane protein [uncultured Parabacteroides sp.]
MKKKEVKFISLLLVATAINMTGNVYAGIVPERSATMNIVQQNGKVTGRVVDSYGPVIGASVVVKGSTNGCITDMDGNFTLEGLKNGDVIQVSYVGYATQEIVYTDSQPTVSITLKEDSEQLDEVVVTALGIKKDAKKLGYAVSTIGSEDLTKTGSSSIATGLYGKAAGVRINSAPGGGTGSISISVRGLSSITGNTQPLIIMDGVPIRNGNANNEDYWANQRIESNGMVDINPEDIENISILKGAAASALYGSEAANGVVMITTKKGKAGSGTQIDFSANVSFDKVAYMPGIQKEYGPGLDNYYFSNSDTKALTGFSNSTYFDRSGNPLHTVNVSTRYAYGAKYDPNVMIDYWDGTKRAYEPIDHNQWADIFRTGVNQTYNLSLMNSTEKNNVRFSYTYNDVKSMQYNSNNNKHVFSLNGTFNVTNNIKLNYTANYTNQYIKNRPYRINRLVQNFGGMFTGFTDVAYLRDHTITSLGYQNSIAAINGGVSETLTPDEQLLYTSGSQDMISGYFWNIFGKRQEEDHQRFIGSVNPTWDIIPGLTLSGRLATDLTVDKTELMENTTNAHIFSTNGQYDDLYSLENSRYSIVYGDVMLMWDKTFNEKHNITANLGWNARQESYYLSNVKTQNGLSQENWFHLEASVGQKLAEMTKQQLLRTGAFLTASYGFDNWGFLEGSIRQEKTSTLRHGNNAFWYPSASASILYTELLKDKRPTWWDYGKVRLSYGVVGNAPEIYMAMMAYEQTSYTRDKNYITNTVPTTLGNENIKPETKYEFELGIENKFLNNRLGMELNFYQNTIKDQILTATAAASMGATGMLMNVGELENKGIELNVYGTPIENKDWRWDLRANVAWNKNRVNKLADGLDVLSHQTFDNGAASLESHVGEAMGDWYTYVWETDENGNYIVGDNGLYIASSERKKVGNAMPKVTGGFGTSLSYKNWTLDASFDFRFGGDVLNQPWQFMMSAGIIEDAIGVRDASTGGLYYYSDTESVSDKSSIHIVPADQISNYERGTTMVNGHYVYDNGLILPGVKEDGTPNNTIVTQYETNSNMYGWGTSTSQSYQDAIQKNSYIKCREISLGYTLPTSLTKKFACKRLQLSAFVRNPFYVYRTLKLFDAETSDGTNWIYQAQIGGSTASSRTYGFSLRASF